MSKYWLGLEFRGEVVRKGEERGRRRRRYGKKARARARHGEKVAGVESLLFVSNLMAEDYVCTTGGGCCSRRLRIIEQGWLQHHIRRVCCGAWGTVLVWGSLEGGEQEREKRRGKWEEEFGIMDPEQAFLRVHARLSGVLARLLTPKFRTGLECVCLLNAVMLLALLVIMHVNFVAQVWLSFCFPSSILTLLYSYILTKGCSPLVISSRLLTCGSERKMRGTSLSLYSLVSSGSAAAYVVFAIPCESCACSEGYDYQMVAISNWVLLQLGLWEPTLSLCLFERLSCCICCPLWILCMFWRLCDVYEMAVTSISGLLQLGLWEPSFWT